MIYRSTCSARFQLFIAVGAALAVVTCSTPGFSAHSQEAHPTPVVGSFGVGGHALGEVNEATGAFDIQIPVVSLPGLDSRGGVELGLSYSQNAAASGVNRYEVGAGFSWSTAFIDVDGGVRVFPASGGVFEADASQQSGLARYTLKDLVFHQKSGVLPARDGGNGVEFAYSLEYLGGGTDYFNACGDLVSHVGVDGERVEWVWDTQTLHRLKGVIDATGSRADLVWSEAGVEVVGPQRADGISAKTVLAVSGSRLLSVTDPVDERMVLGYDEEGFISEIRSRSGSVTKVSYQVLPDQIKAVDCVRVVDEATGMELASREWDILGEHTATGWPTYANQGGLWRSGDGQFRYQTQLFDGATRITSEYNSLGLMVGRDVLVSTGDGDSVAQQQIFAFFGTTHEGGVVDPQMLPAQYQKPTSATVVFHDSNGASRVVVEETVFDEYGRLVKKVSPDGAVAETVYDGYVPKGKMLPVGHIVKETTTGVDGVISRTVNSLSADHKAVVATETFVGSSQDTLISQSREEMTVQQDGFISEKRVVATGAPSKDPGVVVTRFDHTIDHATVTASQTRAAGTTAQSTVSTVTDKATGLPVLTIDPTGRVSKKQYDSANRVVSETDFAGNTTVTDYYDGVKRVTDPTGVTQSTYVDVLDRVVKLTDNIHNGIPNPGYERVVEARKYEHNSSTVTTTDAHGLETVTCADIFGRPVEVKTPNGVRQLTVYDDVANTVSTGFVVGEGGLEKALHVSTSKKDNAGRVVQETGTRVDNVRVPKSQTRYDGLGRVIGQSSQDVAADIELNPDGTAHTTITTPLQSDEFPGGMVVAEREHNVLGVSTKKILTQPDGETHDGVSKVVNAAGQTVSETDQAGKITRYTYTVDGLIETVQQEASGVQTRNTYDPVTRALTLTEVAGVDGSVLWTAYEYDPITGKTVAVFEPSHAEETRIGYHYDVFGNLTQISYPDGKSVHHTFDEYGRKISSTDIVGTVTVYEYDTIGLLTRATQTSSEGAVVGSVEYKYDVLGRMVRLSRGNGVATMYTYTPLNEIKTETTTHADTVISDAAYSYDAHGNLSKRVVSSGNPPLEGGVTGGDLVTETTVYSYDAHNRLTVSSIFDGDEATGDPRSSTAYKMNISGDVIEEAVTSSQAVDVKRSAGTEKNPGGETFGENTDTETSSTTVREFEYNACGHLMGITTNGVRVEQKYDAAGNLTHANDGTEYTYNVHNQPVREVRPDGTTVENTYWANGNRDTTTTIRSGDGESSNETVGLYWDGDSIINDIYTRVEGDASRSDNVRSGAVTGSYLIGTDRHARTITTGNASEKIDGTTYFVTDRHGSVTHVTDSVGTVTAAYTYSDYGRILTLTTAAVVRDQQLNSVSAYRNPFLYAGEYTTETGTQCLGKRFYDPSQMRFTTKDSAQLHNLYAYANGNPITMVDPTGQAGQTDLSKNGAISGISLLIAIVGVALSVPFCGVPITAGGIVASVYSVSVALFDVGVTGVQVLEVLGFEVIKNDRTSKILGWTSLWASIPAPFLSGWTKWAALQEVRRQELKDMKPLYDNFSDEGKAIIECYNELGRKRNFGMGTLRLPKKKQSVQSIVVTPESENPSTYIKQIDFEDHNKNPEFLAWRDYREKKDKFNFWYRHVRFTDQDPPPNLPVLLHVAGIAAYSFSGIEAEEDLNATKVDIHELGGF